MSQIFEYFVVCGIGAEIRSIDGTKGYHGPGWMYLPSLLDQYPPSTHTLYPPAPPQLPTCVLPAGAVFYSSGFDPNDPSTFPRSYPIVLTVSPPMAFNKTFPTRNATQIACVPLHSHQHSDSVVPPMSSSESSTFSQVMARMMIFLKFFATFLSGYRNFLENSATQVFNTQAFLKKRSRSTNQPPELMIAHFLESHGFLDYLERGVGFDENNNTVLGKLQDAIGRGQNSKPYVSFSFIRGRA
ncbi:hypothetical protein TSUD_72190 [Trifolium subterraneum]|uniref:UDENN domain-containing protein n=1 Tax=Trifolium subterraneum TaxID=3900 RepID=A0A2Z6P6D0_TRISU|nr:hypothetical protein TSUD_72190 [Trifolium subterraneum]